MNTKLTAALLISVIVCSCNQPDNKTGDEIQFAALQKVTLTPVANDKEYPLNSQTPAADSTPTPGQLPLKTHVANKLPTANRVEDWTRKIIKTASLSLEVKDSKKYDGLVYSKTKEYGAYVSEANQQVNNEKIETTVSIKVPVQYFDELLNVLADTGVKVTEKTIRSNDVTGEVADTKSRLAAKKEMRLKYLEFLKASKNMTEVLQVQEEINGLQEDIEATAGRYAALSNQSAYSTINLSFFQPLVVSAIDESKPTFISKLIAAFNAGFSWFAELAIALTTVWPLIALVVFGLVIYRRRGTRKALQQKL
ncbi:MAG: hypothetical protein JWQ27_467 [Ferruginibacter sp.]|nr:hypothetical protein [Ferruginibacter sp.]